MNKKITLILTPLKFYSNEDEDLFFALLDKLRCVKNYKGIGRELHVYIKSDKISFNDFINLNVLFKRYKLKNPKQLKLFVNKDNNKPFDSSKIITHSNAYPAKELKYKGKIALIFTPLKFYSNEDEDLFFDWINKLRCVKNYKGTRKELHVYIKSREISFRNFQNLAGLFKRYKLKNPDQLKVFVDRRNRKPFDSFLYS